MRTLFAKPTCTIAVVVTAVLILSASFRTLRAQTPPTSVEQTPRPCVLLNNDNVLFGSAKQVGEFVIVQTGYGGEVKLPRRSVACWSASLQDLYQYRVDHRKDGLLSNHIRDAHWCLKNDLWEMATKELETIKKIDPNHQSIASIEKRIHLAAEATKAIPSLVIQQPAPATSVKADQSRVESPPPSPTDLLALRRFASHVQPMLVNLCGNCHSQGRESVTFALNLPPVGSRASSQMTRDNLVATRAFINANDPDRSDLLVKATSAHGGVDAPLSMRNAKAIHSLRSWLMLASHSHATDKIEQVSHESASHAKTSQSNDEVPLIAQRPEISTTQAEQAPEAPARLPAVANPFDPELFNRRFHPEEN